MFSEEMKKFYKAFNIEYFCDGIGNIAWSYKGINIAGYIDDFDEKVNVYCHWFVDKRNSFKCYSIIPLTKKHKKYFTPNGFSNIPFCQFAYIDADDYDNENEYLEDLEMFKTYLLKSIELLEPRIQILKGKITMLNKHYRSKYTNKQAIRYLCIDDFDKIFNKIRDKYVIKLINGNVLECKEYNANLYAILDGHYVHFINFEDGFECNTIPFGFIRTFNEEEIDKLERDNSRLVSICNEKDNEIFEVRMENKKLKENIGV